MTIGEKIKQLRLQNDITQEKLADYLNISYQAISKWENNVALPDISLVIPLANFFGVSTDELFDRNAQTKAAEIEAYDQKDSELANKGLIPERLALWREAAQKYPRDFHCLINLAQALWETIYAPQKISGSRQQNAKEVIEICERILKDCTENDIRESALQLLVYTYADPHFPMADESKAEQYAYMAGHFYCCAELLLEHAYYTDEGKEKARIQKHRNILTLMDFICMSLYLSLDQTPEEQIFACKAALSLWKTLIYDGNFLFYHGRISSIYYHMAKAHAERQRRSEALENLKMAMEHAVKDDNRPYGEQHYTSVFVSAAVSDRSRSSKNFTETQSEWLKKQMKHSCFDFIRQDPEFIALQNN